MDVVGHIVAVGENTVRLWGLTPRERLARMAPRLGLGMALAPDHEATGGAILADLRFVFDIAWLRTVAATPNSVLTLAGTPVLANCPDAAIRDAALRAMRGEDELPPGLAILAFEQADAATNDELRKRERPFAGQLTPASVRELERASYRSAYKGVTDLLTKYLWPGWALVLTRLAVRAGVSPNAVTAVGAAFCLLATWLFYTGAFWTGLAAGLVFMVLDTVDGKLARCTLTSSKLGEVFDHGIDLVHPPFWYWAWGIGLAAYGRPLEPRTFAIVLATIVAGYVLQRMVEGAFIVRFGMHVHVWRRWDSRFRLITARRNPNMVILAVCLIVNRPDVGLIAVAWWTMISLGVHLVQLIQAMVARQRGRAVMSWLA